MQFSIKYVYNNFTNDKKSTGYKKTRLTIYSGEVQEKSDISF